MSSKDELPNSSDDELDYVPSPKAIKPKQKSKSIIDPAIGDKRKQTSKQNINNARTLRLARIKQEKEAEADQYVIDQSESSDDETELVISKKKKPQVVSADAARIIKLELMPKLTHFKKEIFFLTKIS